MAAFPKLHETCLLSKLRWVLNCPTCVKAIEYKTGTRNGRKTLYQVTKNIKLTRVYENLLKNRFGILQALDLTFICAWCHSCPAMVLCRLRTIYFMYHAKIPWRRQTSCPRYYKGAHDFKFVHWKPVRSTSIIILDWTRSKNGGVFISVQTDGWTLIERDNEVFLRDISVDLCF